MEGVIAINSELNSVILKTKLESFLTPSERQEDLVSYAKIRERFNIEKKGGKDVPPGVADIQRIRAENNQN